MPNKRQVADATALAELVQVPEPYVIRDSMYTGTEIFWKPSEDTYRIVTYVGDFAYTKDPSGLLGDWYQAGGGDWIIQL